MPRWMRGLDELVVEVAAVTLSALFGMIVLAKALNSGSAGRLDAVPVLGVAVRGLRSLVDQVVNPAG
jgi:hypothetical protein